MRFPTDESSLALLIEAIDSGSVEEFLAMTSLLGGAGTDYGRDDVLRALVGEVRALRVGANASALQNGLMRAQMSRARESLYVLRDAIAQVRKDMAAEFERHAHESASKRVAD